MKKTRKGQGSGRGSTSIVKTIVSDGQLERLKRIDDEYTQWFNENRPVYPNPDDFDSLTLPDVEELGFFDKVDVVDFEVLGLRPGKKKPKKNPQQHGTPRNLANPQTILAEVKRVLNGVPKAGNTGNVIIGEWNMEFLDVTKANYFKDTYLELIPLHHVLMCIEVSKDGLDRLANITGYKAYCSVENNRGQAVGFLIHPRMKVIGTPTSYDDVAKVQGLANLRPAYRLDLEDTVTGDKFSVVVVHLKSMRGGPKVTSPVRYQQCQKIATALGSAFKGVVGGDWNTFLDNTTDTDPLTQAGWKLIHPNDKTATQSMGSRLDGFFRLTLTGLGRLKVRNFWKNTKIGRNLSDHGVLTMHHRVCQAGVGNDSTCGVVDSTGTGPFSDNPKDGAEVDTK